jgi:LuxR family transcriptional regulator, maltose regulon positive regulatory protein
MTSSRDDAPMATHVGEAQELLRESRTAMSATRWDEARDTAERAARLEPEDPEILEAWGEAAFFSGHRESTFDAAERAFGRYRELGDDLGSARVAILIANASYDFTGDIPVARGWIGRALRLLEGAAPSRELAFTYGFDGHLAIFREQRPAHALERAEQAADIARILGNIDMEMTAVALQGLALTTLGQVAAGAALLDESCASLMSGEVEDRLLGSLILCYVVAACDRTRDFDRADAWCRAMTDLCTRWSIDAMVASCRTQYASVLFSRGTWDEAEVELETASASLSAERPGMAADAIVRLGELRRRQGRTQEAESLSGQADSHAHRAQAYPRVLLLRGGLALDRGAPAEASKLARRYLRAVDPGDHALRVPGLELEVRAAVASGRIDERTEEAVNELRVAASSIGTLPLRGSASFAEGIVFETRGDAERAKAALEDAVDLFVRAGTPFEEAEARVALASVLGGMGDGRQADAEAEVAERTFARLGAARDAARAAAMIHAGPPPSARDPAGLSPREREVLALVASGKSNEEISQDLFLSVRTVERHVSNIYAKLGASGRTARVVAAEHARRLGLV